jgi:hypothetical protein
MRRVAGGLALLIALSGCSPAAAPTTSTVASSVPASTTPTVATDTTTTLATTTMPTTTNTVVVVAYDDYLGIEARPWPEALPEGISAQVSLPQLTLFAGRPDNQRRINHALESFVADRISAQTAPAAYRLDFTVPWAAGEAWPLLTILFTETTFPQGAAEPIEGRFALLFDLASGSRLAAADMFTAQGLRGLGALAGQRLDAALGEGFCCLASPDSLLSDLGVLPDGLLVLLDETEGVPHAAAPLQFLLPWSQVAPLIDMSKYYLARFAVDEGLCSASGREWALEPQAGLPSAVAAKRAAIFAAATTCDYDALAALAEFPPEITGSVIGHLGTAEAFRHDESWGHQRLRVLAEILNTQYRRDPNGEAYVWPLAFQTASSDIPPSHWSELTQIYGEDEVAWIRENGYIALRIGILPDGTWEFLAAGD